MLVSAIVLSGGRSRRFDGRHKPAVEVGGRTLVSRALGAVRAGVPGVQIWVAGLTDGLDESELVGVHVVREEPHYTGPLAAIHVAVRDMCHVVPHDSAGSVTVVVAGDMPLISAGHVRDLVSACRADGKPATGVDEEGHVQYLCSAWPTGQLLARVEGLGDTANRAVRALYDGVHCTHVHVDPTQLIDVDTVEDLARVESLLSFTAKNPIRRQMGRNNA